MAAPVLAADDYARAFLALLPRGRAWPKEPDSNLSRTVAALAPTYAASGGRAGVVLAELHPGTAAELLPEWEATLGLPDPCQGEAPTLEARRAQAVARFADTGGQTVAHLEGFAADLGYPVEIEEFAPSRAGALRAGDALLGEGSQHHLRVAAPLHSVRFFIAGAAVAGDPLSSWGNDALECELLRIKPAHSRMAFTYA